MSTDVATSLFEEHGFWSQRLQRSRVIAGAATALFGTVGSLVIPRPASADHGPICYGCPTCPCCVWGPGCCVSGCTTCYCGCHSGGICWYTCFHGDYYKCCDFKYPGENCCICRTYLGNC